MVRRAAELAAYRGAELIGVHVREMSGLAGTGGGSAVLEQMLDEFGGRYAEVGGNDVARALARFAHQEQAGLLVIGDTSHSPGHRLMHGSIARRTLRLAGAIEVYVVPPGTVHRADDSIRRARRGVHHVALGARRRVIGWLVALVVPSALLAALVPARMQIGLAGALLCGLLAVVLAAVIGGVGPAMLATVTALVSADFFFTKPYYTLRVAHWIDVVALAVFSVVGVTVGILVDVLAARSRQTARFRAEATQLARLAARVLVEPSASQADLVAELRRIFNLDSVAILSRGEGGWRAQVGAGSDPPENPDAAQFSAELAPDRVLVMTGRSPTRSDAQLLSVFAAELLIARRRVQHGQLHAVTETGARR